MTATLWLIRPLTTHITNRRFSAASSSALPLAVSHTQQQQQQQQQQHPFTHAALFFNQPTHTTTTTTAATATKVNTTKNARNSVAWKMPEAQNAQNSFMGLNCAHLSQKEMNESLEKMNAVAVFEEEGELGPCNSSTSSSTAPTERKQNARFQFEMDAEMNE